MLHYILNKTFFVGEKRGKEEEKITKGCQKSQILYNFIEIRKKIFLYKNKKKGSFFKSQSFLRVKVGQISFLFESWSLHIYICNVLRWYNICIFFTNYQINFHRVFSFYYHGIKKEGHLYFTKKQKPGYQRFDSQPENGRKGFNRSSYSS